MASVAEEPLPTPGSLDVSARIPAKVEKTSESNAGVAQLKKGQRVRATVKGLSGGLTFCEKGDVGKVLAVEEQSIADMQWDNGTTFPTTLYYLENADGGSGQLKVRDRVRRTRPVLDGKGGQLLAAGQLGTIVGVETRVRVAVLFDRRKDTSAGSSGPTKAMWMTYGLEPLDSDSINEQVATAEGGASGSRNAGPTSPEPKADSEQEQLLKVQVQRLNSGSEEQKASAAELLAAYTLRPDGVARLARQEGLLEGLVDLLQPETMPARGALAEAQLQAMVALKNMATDYEVRRRVGEIEGGFRGIVRMLQSDHPAATQQQAAAALGNLAASLPSNQGKIGSEPGALQGLARLLEPGCTSALQESAAAALTNLAICHPVNKQLIGDHSIAINFLTQLIEPENSPAVQLQATIVLGNIAVGNAENQERICAMPGTMLHLTELLGPKNHTLVRLESAVTLKNIAAANYETQFRIGAVPATLEALATLLDKTSPQSLREEAAAALYNLAAGCPANQVKVSATKGVLKGLGQLLDSDFASSAQEKSLLAIKSLVVGQPENGDALLREVPDVLAAIALLLKAGTPPEVQAKAIAVLTSLAHGDGRMLSLIGDVPDTLNDLLHLVEPGHPRSLQKQAAGALNTLKASEKNKSRIEALPRAKEILGGFSKMGVEGSNYAAEVLEDLQASERPTPEQRQMVQKELIEEAVVSTEDDDEEPVPQNADSPVAASAEDKDKEPETGAQDKTAGEGVAEGVSAKKEPETRDVTFKPGKIGVLAKWGTGRITEVVPNGQAEQLGVQVGWRYLRIDGEPYKKALLETKSKSADDSPYVVTYDVSKASFAHPSKSGISLDEESLPRSSPRSQSPASPSAEDPPKTEEQPKAEAQAAEDDPDLAAAIAASLAESNEQPDDKVEEVVEI